MTDRVRKELPTSPGGLYTEEMVCKLQYYQKLYGNAYSMYKEMLSDKVSFLYNCDQITIWDRGVNYGQFSRDNPTSDFLQMIIKDSRGEDTRAYQTITRNKIENKKCRLSRARDYITAFYLPVNFGTVKLKSNENTLGTFKRKYDKKTLEEILEEARVIPLDKSDLSRELEIARTKVTNNGQIVPFSREPFIKIRGKVYERVIFCQPFLPMACLPYCNVSLEFEREDLQDIYIESGITNNKIRINMGKTEYACLFEDAFMWEIVHVRYGSSSFTNASRINYRCSRTREEELFDEDKKLNEIIKINLPDRIINEKF